MIAPITKWKMPSVRQVIGAEMSSMIGLMNALTIPRTRPVRSSEMYLSASPKPYDAFPQVMPGTKKAAIAIAIALISARQMIRMAVETKRATSRLPVRSGRHADEQDDPGEQICDTDHRQDRAHNGGQREEHLQPEPQPEDPDTEGEERDLRDREPEEATERAADHECLVVRRCEPRRLEGARVHLHADRERDTPEGHPDQTTDEPAKEDETG